MFIESQPNESIFDSPAKVLVNPVNCCGIMGAGLALEFKKRYPKNNIAYVGACAYKELRVGTLFTFQEGGKLICNFPTKDNPQYPSRMSYITVGLTQLRGDIIKYEYPSVAIPAIGCGLGNLKWEIVYPEIQRLLSKLHCKIYIYPPRPL